MEGENVSDQREREKKERMRERNKIDRIGRLISDMGRDRVGEREK